ncbi:MAG TPA: DUF2784 domain-containing protein [Acidimicrobiales bacterium]|nr:DUF2784 domain-containing protein [Acidimicrobiales bacterium]
MELVAARLVGLTHFAFVAFLISGGPIGRRFPRVRPAHIATIAITAAINLTGSDCPLTVLEMDLLRASGRVPYDTGFISHYFVEPFHPSGIDGRVNLVLLGAWMVPTALAYGMRSHRAKPNPA